MKPYPGIYDVRDHASVQATIDAASAAGGGVCYFPPGSYALPADLNVPRTVNLQGATAATCILTSASSSAVYVNVTGTTSQQIGNKISNLTFDNVGIRYGNTATDQGLGCVIEYCEIRNLTTDNGVRYRYNCYNTLILGTTIHNCLNGVYIDLSPSGVNSGAMMRVADSAIFTVTDAATTVPPDSVGVYVNGNSQDGHDIHVVNTDLEHLGTCVKTVDSGEGEIFLTNVHAELNTITLVDNHGSNVFVDGLWATSYASPPSTFDALFKCGAGYIYVSHARLTWPDCGLYTLTGGFLVIDLPTVLTSQKYFGLGSCAKGTAACSAGGFMNNGRLFAATVSQAFDPLPADQSSAVASPVYALDVSPRTLEFDLHVTDVPGSANVFRTYLNPGGLVYLDLDLPAAPGGGHFRVVYQPANDAGNGAIQVSGTYNGAYYRAASVDSLARATAVKTIEFASVAASGPPSTMSVHDLFEYVH